MATDQKRSRVTSKGNGQGHVYAWWNEELPQEDMSKAQTKSGYASDAKRRFPLCDRNIKLQQRRCNDGLLWGGKIRQSYCTKIITHAPSDRRAAYLLFMAFRVVIRGGEHYGMGWDRIG